MELPEPEFHSLRGDFKVILRKEKTETEIQNNTESEQKWTEVNRLKNQKQLKIKFYI